MSEQRHLVSITHPPLGEIWVPAIRKGFFFPDRGIPSWSCGPAVSVREEGGERDELQKPPCRCPSSAASGEGSSGRHVGLGRAKRRRTFPLGE